MKKPDPGVKRAAIYLVTPVRGEWFGNAGRYVGETETRVVLNMGELARGFDWKDVEPVKLKETE